MTELPRQRDTVLPNLASAAQYIMTLDRRSIDGAGQVSSGDSWNFTEVTVLRSAHTLAAGGVILTQRILLHGGQVAAG